MESLDLPYAKGLILKLFENGEVPMTRLQSIATSYSTVIKIVESLRKDGLVNVRDVIVGRKTRLVSLTSMGEGVAHQLKRTEAVAKGRKFTFPDKFGIITLLDASEKLTMNEIADLYPDPASILRELESLKLIKQTIDTSQYPMQNYFSLTEKGKKVADKLKEIENLIRS